MDNHIHTAGYLGDALYNKMQKFGSNFTFEPMGSFCKFSKNREFGSVFQNLEMKQDNLVEFLIGHLMLFYLLAHMVSLWNRPPVRRRRPSSSTLAPGKHGK